MLTVELLKKQESLSTLTDEQLTAIASLSQNDEKVVKDKLTGELHGLYDVDILSVSGIEKEQGEKTYNYNKRVLSKFKAEKEDLIKEIETLKASSKGKDVSKEVQELTDKLGIVTRQYEADKLKFEDEKKVLQGNLTSYMVDSEFEKAKASINFKKEYPESVLGMLYEKAKENILKSHQVEFSEMDGKKVLVFKNKEGVLLNKTNGLKPYTASELLSENLKDVIDTGRKVEGAGSHNSKNEGVASVDVSSAKTQLEADAVITKYLAENGYTRGSAAFANKQAEIRTSLGVERLPLREN